ncbi:stAR-related lipid transfer protein 3-like [Periplaneta americana]|uniref:stAR-related lipid transfer protein 3-like n=1 Tax=Periplaneta americana TaxID=6978 RepID=UPI0037E78D86
MKFFKHLLFGDQNANSEKLLLLSDEEYRRRGEEVLELSWNILNSTDDWKLEKRCPEGDTVYSKYIPGLGKVFKLTGEVNFAPKKLMTELYDKIENLPSWNPTLIESREVQAIDECTDVSYQVTAEFGGGLVSSREFVNVRRRGMKDNCYIAAGAAVTHPAVPPHKKYIRGENGPNCWVCRPISGATDHCTFQWLLNTNLHGWLPQYVVDSSLTTVMTDYIKHIRVYGQKLKQQGLMGS